MVIGIKDTLKLLAISVITGCAVFVCTLFLNHRIDIAGIKDEITSPQGMILYEALASMGKMITVVAGGCLLVTTVIILIFYIKNYIDSHGKELGILKALGHSDFSVAKHFWVFGLSVLLGCGLGYIGSTLYMPRFYEAQNSQQLFPELIPHFHIQLFMAIVILPTLFFMVLSVFYAFLRMKRPVLHLLKEVEKVKVKVSKKETKDLPFLQDLRKSTLRSRKILVFFVGFSALCFSSMVQMSASMDDLASESFSAMLIAIGLILAFMTLLISLSSVVKANTKSIAMMKVMGYSQKECSHALLGGYRPVAYIGFAIGTVYQYMLLKITVVIFMADYENTPEYNFNIPGCIITLVAFIICYELMIAYYANRINKLSIKGIMLE